jgi:hypothetical protein
MKKMNPNKTILKYSLFFYVCVVFLYSCNGDHRVNKVINNKNNSFKCNEIIIPVFQPAQVVSENCIEERFMKILIFKSNITYPSTEIYQFYEDHLKKNGFQAVSLKNLDRNDRRWIILHTDSAVKKRYQGHYKAFWQNKKNQQIWWLELTSNITNIQNENNQIKKNGSQNVFIIAKIFDPMPSLDEIFISHFYPELSTSELKKEYEEKEIDQSIFPFAGYYTLGNVKLHFRIAELPSKKENISEGYEETYDLDGRLNYVSRNIEISEKDIHHLVVKKSNYDTSINVQITFKDDFISEYQKKGIGLKGKWIGLFKGEKLIFVAYFHESIEKVMILNFEDLSKLKIILEGMIKKKE